MSFHILFFFACRMSFLEAVLVSHHLSSLLPYSYGTWANSLLLWYLYVGYSNNTNKLIQKILQKYGLRGKDYNIVDLMGNGI